MDRLLEGHLRFREETWPAMRRRYEELASGGQHPETLVIACSDSRVDPAAVFGAGPGELFTVRNVAGLVPPYKPDGRQHGVSAALEFAVRVLEVKRIVVLGHAQCGGVRAMVDGAPEQARDFVAPWMKIAEPALRRIPKGATREEALTLCEAEVVRLSRANLLTFPWIAEAVEQDRVALHTYLFAIQTGVLLEVGPDGTHPAV